MECFTSSYMHGDKSSKRKGIRNPQGFFTLFFSRPQAVCLTCWTSTTTLTCCSAQSPSWPTSWASCKSEICHPPACRQMRKPRLLRHCILPFLLWIAATHCATRFTAWRGTTLRMCATRLLDCTSWLWPPSRNLSSIGVEVIEAEEKEEKYPRNRPESTKNIP